jgi:hypothetical protein
MPRPTLGACERCGVVAELTADGVCVECDLRFTATCVPLVAREATYKRPRYGEAAR